MRRWVRGRATISVMTSVETTDRSIQVSRTIDAPPERTFALIADPDRHPDLDSSGMVRASRTHLAIEELGDVFTMDMHNELFGDYTIENHVVVYEPDVAAPDDKYMTLVRRGYQAFNSADLETLRSVLSHDVVQHVPGTSQVAGAYKGIDAVLGYYGKLAELTEGQFRADLIEVYGDGQGHVTALHQITATRNGATRVSRGTITFTFLGDRATDLVEMHADLPGDDAFLG